MARFRYTALSALVLGGVVGLFPAVLPAAEKVDQVIAVGEARAKDGKASQQRIDKLSDQAGTLLREYKQVIKVVDGLQVYNGLLQKQVDNQGREMAQLTESIGQVALIERQIVPLMVRMIDSLDEFVRLDVPFLPEERNTRVERLRTMMERSDVTVAEKFRRVLEAYQIENEYGRTIESYKGSLEVAGKRREVDFLRVGRVALIYQAVGGTYTGAWDKVGGGWAELPAEQYKSSVAKGLRVARKQVAPDLLTLPVAAAEELQ